MKSWVLPRLKKYEELGTTQWVEMNNLVYYSGCNVLTGTLFRNLQKRSLVSRERGTLQTHDFLLWSTVRLSVI